MRYFELLQKCKDKYGELSSRDEQLIYDAIDIYTHSFNEKENQFKMELASHILMRNSEEVLHGIGKKEPLINNCIALADMFIKIFKSKDLEED